MEDEIQVGESVYVWDGSWCMVEEDGIVRKAKTFEWKEQSPMAVIEIGGRSYPTNFLILNGSPYYRWDIYPKDSFGNPKFNDIKLRGKNGKIYYSCVRFCKKGVCGRNFMDGIFDKDYDNIFDDDYDDNTENF